MKISKKTAEHYVWGANCDGWYLLNGDSLSIIHERMPSGLQRRDTIIITPDNSFLSF